MTNRPQLLLIALDNWLGIARLPKALQEAGFDVTVITPQDSFLSKTRYIDRLITLAKPLNGNDVLAAIAQCFERAEPQVVIPGDEVAMDLLYRISIADAEVRSRTKLQNKAFELIDLSLGGKTHKHQIRRKIGANELAISAGLHVPPYREFHSFDEAAAFGREHSYPVIVKPENGFAGVGVGIVRNEEELRTTFPLIDNFARSNGGIQFYIQLFVEGRVAMFPFASSRGKIFAGFGGFKEQCYPEITGPTSVIRRTEHQGMIEAATRLIRATEFTGFGSIDFIIDNRGTAHFLELNARPVPVTHLGPLLGSDLCAALYDSVTGSEPRMREPEQIFDVIALYPQELLRDPASIYLITEHVDRPINDDELLRSYQSQVDGVARVS